MTIKDAPIILPEDLKKGNLSAFDEVFHEFYGPLCFFASRIVQDKAIAEDIVQDIFLKFWEHHKDFKSIGSIKAYLYTSTRNSSLNHLEKNKVRLKHQDYVLAHEEMGEDTILENLIRAEVLRQVFATVDTLPEQCRRVIRMTFEEGKTPKEIADELGISVSTVNNQKMRGLNLLRNRLPDEGLALGLAIFLPGLLEMMR